jgi:hypothetical protein
MRQVSLTHVVPISCIYQYDCMLVMSVRIVEIPMCHIFSCIILVTWDLSRILVIFYVILSLPSLELTKRIG